MNIQSITSDETLDIRHTVLWPDKPLSFCKVEGDETAHHYGAFIDEELICVASIYITNSTARLRKFATLKNFQGKGIGRLLLNRCINFAKEQNANEIFLLTNDILKPALNLYLSCGFVKDRYDDHRYERGNTKMTLMLGDI